MVTAMESCLALGFPLVHIFFLLIQTPMHWEGNETNFSLRPYVGNLLQMLQRASSENHNCRHSLAKKLGDQWSDLGLNGAGWLQHSVA